MPAARSAPRMSQCKYCPMAFKKLEHAQRHERTHTLDRPYPCSVCGKAFARQDTLNRHARLHTQKNDPKRRKKAPSPEPATPVVEPVLEHQQQQQQLQSTAPVPNHIPLPLHIPRFPTYSRPRAISIAATNPENTYTSLLASRLAHQLNNPVQTMPPVGGYTPYTSTYTAPQDTISELRSMIHAASSFSGSQSPTSEESRTEANDVASNSPSGLDGLAHLLCDPGMVPSSASSMPTKQSSHRSTCGSDILANLISGGSFPSLAAMPNSLGLARDQTREFLNTQVSSPLPISTETHLDMSMFGLDTLDHSSPVSSTGTILDFEKADSPFSPVSPISSLGSLDLEVSQYSMDGCDTDMYSLLLGNLAFSTESIEKKPDWMEGKSHLPSPISDLDVGSPCHTGPTAFNYPLTPQSNTEAFSPEKMNCPPLPSNTISALYMPGSGGWV